MNEREIEHVFSYHIPTADSIKKLQQFRESAKIFAKILMELVPECPDKSVAVRKLRECVMTGNAAIVLNQREENDVTKI